MSALRDFVAYAKSTAAGSPNVQNWGPAPGAPVQAGPTPAGPDAPAASPGGGTKKGVSFDVYNPGDDKWDLELGPDGTLQGAGSAGAIIRGTNYGDYEGWKDVDFNSPWDDKDNNIHLVFKISWRTRGHPKDDSLNDRYVADVRVSGKKTALGGAFRSAHVELVRAGWGHSDLGDKACVRFWIVLWLANGQIHRREFILGAHGEQFVGNKEKVQ
jgi:hypothetical protein